LKIYTGKGDSGETALIGGRRISKGDIRVAAYGYLDELSASLGLACALEASESISEIILLLQRLIHRASSQLACTDGAVRHGSGIEQPDVDKLERMIDEAEAELQPLKQFIAYGGTPCAAQLQLARAVCRRAERSIVVLSKREDVDPVILRFVNRLSDCLFVLGRLVNKRSGVREKSLQGR